MLLDAPLDAAPAGKMLAFLNQVAPVEYLSLVAYRPEPQQAPQHVEGHGWRNEISEREHLSDRLSFIYAPVPPMTLRVPFKGNSCPSRF